MSDNEHKEFEQRTRELFDREVTDLDAATRSKLNQARQRALAELDRPAWSPLRMPLPQAAAGAVAVAAISAFLVFRTDVAVVEPDLDFAAASDIEILLAEDDMEFLEELEFYAWLEEQPEFADIEDTLEGAG